MTRKMKALGLALFAVLAMGALFAGGAQAEEGTIEADVGAASQVTLTGEAIGHFSFETALGALTCEETSFEGTIEDGDHDITLKPTIGTCTMNVPFAGSLTTTMTMNGCEYTFTGGNEDQSADHFSGITVSLVCPQGQAVEIHVYNSNEHGVGHNPENQRCTHVIHPFTHKLHTTAENIAGQPDDVELTTNLTDIVMTRVSGSFFQCGSVTSSTDYTSVTTLRAYSDEAHENQVRLTLTDVG